MGISAGTGMAIMGGASLLGGVLGSNASQNAAQTQANAAGQATASNNANLERQIGINAPFVTAGTNAMNKLSSQAPYTPSAFNFKADPGYAFTLGEGLKSMNASAAARGGLISGNALTAGQQYGQGLGSTYYQQAYQNYLSKNAQDLQAYNVNTSNNQFLTGIGQASANNTGAAIGTTAASNASNIIGAGNATAAGQVGSVNAYNNAISQGIGAYQTNALINSIRNNNTSAYTGPNNYQYTS